MEQGVRFADMLPLERPAAEEAGIALERLLPFFRRQWPVLVAGLLAGAAAGLLYLLVVPPVFTASASLIIDTGNRPLADGLSSAGAVLDDQASIMGQVELLKSERIALEVARRLDLGRNPQLLQPPAGPLAAFLSWTGPQAEWLGLGGPPVIGRSWQGVHDDGLLRQLAQGLTVTRIAGTAVLRIDYASRNPALSARVARAFVDVYLADRVEARAQATRKAGDWLMTRIADLRQKALASDLAVQKFKGAHDLLSSEGRLVSDQQLTQIGTALAAAKSARADAEARHSEIRKIIASGDPAAMLSDGLASPVITDLRARHAEAARRRAEIAARLGETHGRARKLKSDMDDYRRLMVEELERTARVYENDVRVAEARQKRLETQLSEASGVSATANDFQVELRQLEREAASYKHTYETYLERYQEALQQQTFPLAEARVISEPYSPSTPSSPRMPVVLTLSLFAGLLAGTGLGAVREWRDRGLRTADQVRDLLGLQPLGYLPDLPKAERDAGLPQPPVLRHPRLIERSDPLVTYVADHPLSAFAEAIRAARIAVDARLDLKQPRLVGIVSALPGEGKSTVAVNFAEMLAAQGCRTMLVDADLRNPALTRQIAPLAERGLIEVLEDGQLLREVLMLDQATRLGFLPAVVKRRTVRSSELLMSEAMGLLIARLAASFDYVVFDLPPMGPLVDARALMPKLDACLLVVEWGATPWALLRDMLAEDRQLARKCAGVLLNKVDMARMKLYRSHGSREFYASRYGRYYMD